MRFGVNNIRIIVQREERERERERERKIEKERKRRRERRERKRGFFVQIGLREVVWVVELFATKSNGSFSELVWKSDPSTNHNFY